jgi:hypothetical protein
MSVKYVFADVIRTIERKVVKQWVSGTGDKAVFADEGIGWYATLESCPASLWLGDDEPPFKTGDTVRLTLERA